MRWSQQWMGSSSLLVMLCRPILSFSCLKPTDRISLAYRAGVTSAIVAPLHKRFYGGLGTFFSTGSLHKLQRGAVIQDKTGVHISVRHFGKGPSVSTQISALRKLLLGGDKKGDAGRVFEDVVKVRAILFQDQLDQLLLLRRKNDNTG